jgi:hypothetical protein
MTDLFDPPPAGRRGGDTFDPASDYVRLNRQANDVWCVMRDMRWHTLSDIARQTGHPQASISARLRDFRKGEFGGHEVQRERMFPGSGLYHYRLVPNQEVTMQARQGTGESNHE